VLGVCVWVTVDPPYDNTPPIRSDGLGYYAWTEALLRGNLDFCQWHTELDSVAAISAQNPQHPQRCENKYPPGLALLRLPVMGPVSLLTNNSPAADLYVSPAEERANQILSVLALLVTLACIHLTLTRLAVGACIADLAVLATCWGTGLFHYATYDSSFTHIDSAALFAGLLLLGVSCAQRGRAPHPAPLFGLIFFIALIRSPDIPVLLVLLCAWLIWRVRGSGVAPWRSLRSVPVTTVAAIATAEAIQLIYTHWSSGRWTLSSYGPEPFSLSQGKELEVLTSYDHGLLIWYPVVGVMLILALWRRQARGWGLVALVSVAVLTVIYGSWNPWYLGGAFGMRGFVDIVPVISVAGALGAASLSPRGRGVALLATTLCVLLTVELLAGYWGGTLPDGAARNRDSARVFWQQVVGDHSFFSSLASGAPHTISTASADAQPPGFRAR
jgi:hypothetical protein